LKPCKRFFQKFQQVMKKTGEGLILRGLGGRLRRQAGSHKGPRWLQKHSGHKKAPQVRG